MAVDQGKEQADELVQPDSESYQSLLDEYTHLAPAEGALLEGTVLKVTASDVIVDFGYKSEGLVPIDQFRGAGGELTVQTGDIIDVMIDHGEQPEGYVLLSHAKAARVRVWDNLEKAFADQLVILGHVLGRVKGGLSVDVGIEAFMPGSQVDPRPVHHLDSFIGQDVPVKIIKVNRRRGNVVVSRKLAVEQEVNQRKTTTLDQLSEGAIVTGVVKNLTDYGAFVDLGGLDGLLHVTDMSYGRVGHPSEIVHVGDTITAKVLKFDRAKERVSLGIRQTGAGSVGNRDRALPGERPRDGPGGECHGLRGVRGTGARRGRAHPHHRDDLVAAHEASVESSARRRSGGGRRAGSEPARPAHFTGTQTARSESLDHHRQPLQYRVRGRRPGAQHDRFRRLHRDRGGHRRAGARFRSLVDQARQASVGNPEEGPARAGRDSEYRRQEPPAVTGYQTAPAGCLGDLHAKPPAGRYRTWAHLASGGFWGVRGTGGECRRTLPFFGSAGLLRAALGGASRWQWARNTISRSSR